MKRLTESARIGTYMTPKDFRHNVISWTDQENALATQEVVGHSGLAVERKHFHPASHVLQVLETIGYAGVAQR